MNLLGLIVEYNPFHNGHKYHLEKSKEITNATHTVAIMSGNFCKEENLLYLINIQGLKWLLKMELI